MAAVTVTTSETTIHTARGGSAGAKESVAIRADDANAVTIYLGHGPTSTNNPVVTTAIGFPLAAGETITVDLIAGETITGIVSAGTATVRTLVVGN